MRPRSRWGDRWALGPAPPVPCGLSRARSARDIGFPAPPGGVGTAWVSEPPAGGARERHGWSRSPSGSRDSGSRRASRRSAGVPSTGSEGRGGRAACSRRGLPGRSEGGRLEVSGPHPVKVPAAPTLPARRRLRASSQGRGPSLARRRRRERRVQGGPGAVARFGPGRGRRADPQGSPKLARKVRRSRRGGAGARERSGPGSGDWGAGAPTRR